MAIVICTLPNASTRINGVAFTPDRGQMISEEVDDATAAAFRGIPGYLIAGDDPAPTPDEDSAPLMIANAKGRKAAV